MPVNVRDYSRSAAVRGWGAGWPTCAGARGNLVTITFARSGVRISVHRRIAELTLLLADWTEAQGYLAKNGQTGSYNCRPIGGTKISSQHAWGLAVDWNWQDNPYTASGKRSMPDWMPERWSRYGFGWGGWYRGAKKDFMHLEFMGTPADADMLTALARREIGAAARTPAAPLAPTPAPAAPPPIREDEPMAILPIRIDDRGRFHETCMVEGGGSSPFAEAAALTLASTWGRSRMVVTALDHTSRVLYQWPAFDLATNEFGGVNLPPEARIVTVEGYVEHARDVVDSDSGEIVQPATRPAVSVHTKART